MQKKRRAILVACTIVCAIIMCIMKFSHTVMIPEGITREKALQKMPELWINEEDKALLAHIMSTPEIIGSIHAWTSTEWMNEEGIITDWDAAVDAGAITDWVGEKAYPLFGNLLPPDATGNSVSVLHGVVYVDYQCENNRLILSCFPDGAISKAIAVYREKGWGKVNVELKHMYENFENEAFRLNRPRLKFG